MHVISYQLELLDDETNEVGDKSVKNFTVVCSHEIFAVSIFSCLAWLTAFCVCVLVLVRKQSSSARLSLAWPAVLMAWQLIVRE